MSRCAILRGMLVTVAIIASTGVRAQVQEPATSESAESGLSDIIVTAQKRSENLQTVPISVTAVSGAVVDQLHAATLQGLQGTVPNIQIDNFSNTPNTAVVTIRGIGVIEPDAFAGQTVSIVVDGVPQFYSVGALVDLYDIDRIEILRGPQGTLFGANTTGGVVNIVTAQPTGELGGKGELSYGNYNHLTASGTLDFPITEGVLAGKITISHDRRKGFVTNVVDGSDMGKRNVTIYRGYLKFTPTPDFDATLIGEYDIARNGAAIVANGALPGEGIYAAPGVQNMYQSVCPVANRRCQASDPYFSANDSVPDVSDLDTYRATLTMNLRNTVIGDITAITGYKHFKVLEFTDQDATPLFLADTKRGTSGWQFSQELRSSLDITDSVNILYGGFYSKNHYDAFQGFRIGFVDPGLLQRNEQDQDNYSVSGFVHTFIKLGDALRLQAGIRYTHEKTDALASTITSINLTGRTDFDTGANTVLRTVAPPRGSKSWDNVGWKLGVDYQINQGPLLYGYWARGFKSGGFTGRIGIEADVGPFDPEKVDTFEAGLKTDLLDRRLRLNLSGFLTKYRDVQVGLIYFDRSVTPALQGNTILNAAKATIKGFELEATALPTEGLTLTGSLAYLDAKYDDFPFIDPLTITPATPLGVPTNLRGSRLQNAPRWSATAGVRYEADIGPGMIAANVLYSYTASKYLSAIQNTARALVQPTHLVDANLDFSPSGSQFTVGIWARNIFDNRYIQSVFDNPGYGGIGNYASPRQYGATVKAKF